MSYLNAHYESFISLSSSLTPLPDLLLSIEEFTTQIKEKTQAVALIVEEGRREVEDRLQEREEGEERVRWLKELQDTVERVKRIQVVMAEMEEEREGEEREGAEAPADNPLASLPPIKQGMRGRVRAALLKAREGGGEEERRRREERRAKRRGGADGGDEDEDEDVEDYGVDESVKRQHNAAYDLFLSLLSSPAPSPPPFPSPSHLTHLTHLTFLFIAVNTSLTFTSSFSLIASLSTTLTPLSTSFYSHMSRALVSSLSPTPSPSSLRTLLRLYLLLDAASTAQSIIKDQIVTPYLTSLITLSALRTPPTTAPPHPPSNLPSIYTEVEGFAKRILPILQSASSFSPHSFDWWGDVFFSATSSALIALGPALFSPGTPSLFHFHYIHTTAFLASLSTLAESCGVSDLLHLPVVDGFVKKWNVGIYFRLRFQAIASKVEGDCLKGAEEGVQVVEAVKTALSQCWSESVWLPELTPSFMRLSLQCIERFASMVDSACVTHSVQGSEGGEGSVVAAFPTPLLFHLYVDVKALIDFIGRPLRSLITARLGSDNAPLIAPTLAPSVTRLESLLPLLHATLTTILSHSCAPPLAQIARLPTVYRMTSKRPTAPSPYIAQLLKALVACTSTPPSLRWSEGDRRELTRSVVVAVVGLMAEKVTSVLELAVRTEASLRMLRRSGAAAGGGAGGEMTEVEKIRGQLELDVKELERGVAEDLGVTRVTPLQDLATTVRTAGLSTHA